VANLGLDVSEGIAAALTEVFSPGIHGPLTATAGAADQGCSELPATSMAAPRLKFRDGRHPFVLAVRL
jgi:hypothetical protein